MTHAAGITLEETAHLDDETLIAEFARSRGQEAFRIIVQRHASWIYGAAFRQLRERHAAEDATQAVFMLLCQRAAQMNRRQKVAGWLFVALRYTVKAMLRAQRRRQVHERRAAMERVEISEPKPAFTDHLDAAVGRLGVADQMAIVLRFYEGLEFAAVAGRLGISERAARKRVDRAVGKLRGRLGAAMTAEGMSAALAYGVPTSPGALCAQVNHAALGAAGGATVSTGAATAAKGAVYLMTMTKVKIAAGLVLVVSGAVVMSVSALMLQTPPPPQRAPVRESGTAPQAAVNVENIYTLNEDEAIGRLLPPYPPARTEFYRQLPPPPLPPAFSTPQAQVLLGHGPDTLPDAMLIGLENGKRQAQLKMFHTQGFALTRLLNQVLHLVEPEIEGDKDLVALRLQGDIVVKNGATAAQYCASLEKILSEEAHHPVTLTFREVERPVAVLKGTWKYSPLTKLNPTQALSAKVASEKDAKERPELVSSATSLRVIEVYGRDLDRDSYRGAEDARQGDGHVFAKRLSDWIKTQVVMEGIDVPPMVRWYEHATGNGTEESGKQAHDRELVLQRITEQTGLTGVMEVRKVRRLFIERVK